MRNQFIGTVAGELGINPRTLRYYEAQGLLPRPSRTKSGSRVYDSRTGSESGSFGRPRISG